MIRYVLRSARKEQKISRAIVVDGLCSVSMLQQIEAGKKEPEKLLGDALMQRLGKSMDRYEIILDAGEYDLAKRRVNIQSLIHKSELAGAEKELKEYRKQKGAKSPLHRQFLCLQWAELLRRRNAEDTAQEKILLQGLAQTIPAQFWNDNRKPEIHWLQERRFGFMELLLLEHYALLLEDMGQKKQAYLWYQELILYVTQEWYAKEDARKICSLIAERMPFIFFKGQIFWRKADNDKQGGRYFEKKREQVMKKYFPEYPEKNVHSINEIVGQRRRLLKMKKTDLLDIYAEAAAIDRIERGYCSPQKDKRGKLLKRFGISELKYDAGIVSECCEDLDTVEKLMSLSHYGQDAEAEKLLENTKKYLKADSIEVNAKNAEEMWKILENCGAVREQYTQIGCNLMRHERNALLKLAMLYASGAIEKKNRNLLYEILKKQHDLIYGTEKEVFFSEYFKRILHCLSRMEEEKGDIEAAERYRREVLPKMQMGGMKWNY